MYVYDHQAVDVVGQAGKPKTITGFQTHTTPVLLAYGERAELATDECILALCRITCHVHQALHHKMFHMEAVFKLVNTAFPVILYEN